MNLHLFNIPEHMHSGIIGYVEDGWRPGSFLNAVLCNNLFEAASCADDINRYHLYEYAHLLYEIPRACWGSQEVVDEWVKHQGLRNAQR